MIVEGKGRKPRVAEWTRTPFWLQAAERRAEDLANQLTAALAQLAAQAPGSPSGVQQVAASPIDPSGKLYARVAQLEGLLASAATEQQVLRTRNRELEVDAAAARAGLEVGLAPRAPTCGACGP
jgi:hypothetical protein